MKNIAYFSLGILFGLTLIKSQVVSWYRIQEMFLFDNFHMYGVICTAIFTAGISLFMIKRFKIETISRQQIDLAYKELNTGTIAGGILFGLGWSLIGACPGPLYALVGNGALIYLLGIASAMIGVITFGFTLGKSKESSA